MHRAFVMLATCGGFMAPFLAMSAARLPADEMLEGLVTRVAPGLRDRVRFEGAEDESGRDVFEIESVGDRIVLRGNNGVAKASALKRYIEQFARGQISWDCGDQLALTEPLPVSSRLRVVSPHRFRYVYNYCTHGYTMAWWDWPRWERELDFLALNGVNLALVIEGQEQVWIDALEPFGYSAAEVRQWLCMPSHQPWQYMSNIESYGGPLSQDLVDRRLALGRQIIARMRALGIEPVLQGYYGIVPSDFGERFPGAKVHAQGGWGGLKRPDMLDPLDPLFAKVAAAFYAAQSRDLGETRFFAADPFHEGGDTSGIDLGRCGQVILDAMTSARADSTWVLQSWQTNPAQPMLDALDKSRLLVLDLFCESTENWRTRNQFEGTPWLWCTIHNFGGNVGLSGDLAALAERPARALAEAGPGVGQMCGIGALMEGSGTQPLVWEMFFGNAWRSTAPDFDTWLSDYCRRRYGDGSAEARRAMQLLSETVYAANVADYPLGSVVCARPELEPWPKARFWGTTKPYYDTTRVAEAWRLLLEAAPSCEESDGFRYDLADVGRQVLSDLFGRYHEALVGAYARRDGVEVHRLAGKMLRLLDDFDELLATRREFLLGVWLADARRWGGSEEEADLCERCARELVTIWSRHESQTVDYAHRQWSGLVKGFYETRWHTWLAAVEAAVATEEPLEVESVRSRIVGDDHAWTLRHEVYPTEARGDTVEVSRRLFGVYSSDASSASL